MVKITNVNLELIEKWLKNQDYYVQRRFNNGNYQTLYYRVGEYDVDVYAKGELKNDIYLEISNDAGEIIDKKEYTIECFDDIGRVSRMITITIEVNKNYENMAKADLDKHIADECKDIIDKLGEKNTNKFLKAYLNEKLMKLKSYIDLL